ncbi:MAG: histidine--tRNA ligase [Proteobacteria bacterium]|nr:MAG: histidine--tRNA ligase [Pseudomonadota bacterium]
MGETPSKLIEARTLKGFHDCLPREAILKNQMLAVLRAVFESFGYVPIETPHLEYSEILVGEASAEIKKQMYRFQDNGGRDVALRFDLTVPFARFVVQHRQELGVPFKRYAIGDVFRGESPQLGRYRQFTQCDFDFVGTSSVSSDSEIVQVIFSALSRLKIPDFTVNVNHRKILNGLAAKLGLQGRGADLLRIVDKLDKIGAKDVQKELVGELGIDSSKADEVLAFVELSQGRDNAEVLTELQRYKSENEFFSEGIRDLESFFSILEESGIDSTRCKLNLAVARGLGYYTGIVYETMINTLPQIGSVCSGGRYDNLTKTFSKDPLPGVGASVGLDRLIAAMTELKLAESSATCAQVLFAQMDETLAGKVHKAAGALRDRGLAVEVFPEAVKLAKQFKYADQHGHRFVVVLGEDEVKRGAFTLKNLTSGQQIECKSLEDLSDQITSGLN